VDIHLFDESGKMTIYKLKADEGEKPAKTVVLAVDRQLCWDSIYPVDYLKVQGLCQCNYLVNLM